MKRAFVLLLFVVTPTAVFAQSPSSAPVPPAFVAAERLNVAAVWSPHPANDSELTRKELAILHSLQKSRSAVEIAHAQADDAEEDIFIFRRFLGSAFTRD